LLFLSLFHRRLTTPTLHAEARTSSRTHSNSDIRVPLFKKKRDQIIYAPAVIIIQVCGVCVCVCVNMHRECLSLTLGGTGRRRDHFPWRIDSRGSPTDSRGDPHHVYV